MGGYAIAESLVWGDKNSEIHKQEFDMIVLADCVYYEDVITNNNFLTFIASLRINMLFVVLILVLITNPNYLAYVYCLLFFIIT